MGSNVAVVALATGLLLAGCGTTAGTHPAPTAGLAGAEWVVADIVGRGVVDDSQVTLMFGDDGRLSGSASCNRLIGKYVAEGTTLRISDAGLTMMACPPALMDQEQRLVEVLNAVDTYRIDETGTLVLSTHSGATVTARRGTATSSDL